MRKKLKVHDGNTPAKTFEVKIEYPKLKVATMSDKEFPSCAYDVCAEFDCEETMALALIATRNELERTHKALDVAVDALNTVTATPLNSRVIHDVVNKALEQITAILENRQCQ